MIDLVKIKPDINVRESEFIRLLGYPYGHVPKGRAKELADWARDWYNKNGNPWIYAADSSELTYTDSGLYINGANFSSKQLHDQFLKAGADRAVLAAVSAGKELEETARALWHEDKPDEYFFLEVYGSAVVEHLLVTAGSFICSESENKGHAVLPHYSPGYTGWNINDQKTLYSILNRDSGFRSAGELNILDSGMLNPKKSMLAVFGITKYTERVKDSLDMIPCRSCSMLTCRYRRSPYKHYIKQPEDVSRFNAKVTGEKSVLDKEARYSVNIKALQKWSAEKLQLEILPDKCVNATFRYEGSTCSNLGHPLKYEHRINLSPEEEGYKIIKLECVPVNGDDGYTYMCEYIRDPEELEQVIQKEKPYLGQPLNEILKWDRQYTPEGCYCKKESRDHKWGLAFEVLHYALVNKQKSNGA